MKNETVARLWTVFAREDAPLLARWLALRGSALDEPCLAFEAQREARETAAAAPRRRARARALADAHPGEPRAREAAAAAAAAAEAGEDARRKARAAFDAAAGVSPRLAASALRRRDAFVLDAVSLEHLRRDLGIAPARRDVPQHFGETFFVPAGCPRFAVAHTKHAVARWFFLSPGSASRARCGWRTSLGFWRAATPSAATRLRVRARRSCARRCAWRRACGRRARGSSTPPRETRTKNKKKTTALAREAEETRGGETPSSMAFHEAGREPNGERDERDERDETVRDARGIERRTRDGFRVNPIVA